MPSLLFDFLGKKSVILNKIWYRCFLHIKAILTSCMKDTLQAFELKGQVHICPGVVQVIPPAHIYVRVHMPMLSVHSL